MLKTKQRQSRCWGWVVMRTFNMMIMMISWCLFSFSTYISELTQTYLRALSPHRPYQELNIIRDWRLMCTDNFHFHAKNYHYFHPLTTASLWFTDQMSTQSTRKQVIKITTFEKVKCPLLVKYGKSSVASSHSHTCPPAPTSRWPLKPPSWQPTFKRGI